MLVAIILHSCWLTRYTLRYSCNRYDEDEAKQARDAQEKSRAALQRYLFYCNRYMNHMQSLKFEHKLYASVKEKMEEMQQHNMSWIEASLMMLIHSFIPVIHLVYSLPFISIPVTLSATFRFIFLLQKM